MPAPAMQQPCAEERGELELTIVGLGGPLCTVTASRSWLVKDVKIAVAGQTQIPEDSQRLLKGAEELQESQALAAWPSGVVSLTLVRRSPEQTEWLRASRTNWHVLLQTPEAWEDREVVLSVVSLAGCALQHASEDLRADRGIALAAVQQNGLALQFIAPELAGDQEVVLAAVERCGRALHYASADLRESHDFVLDAVSRNGRALQHAPVEFQKDREVVLAAVSQSGFALASACPQLRADYELVAAAIHSAPCALAFAAAALRNDPELVELARKCAVPSEEEESLGRKRKPDAAPAGIGSTSCQTYGFAPGKSSGHRGVQCIIGTEAAQLCEMAALGLPVAPGFCFVGSPGELAGDGKSASASTAAAALRGALEELEEATARRFGHQANPLLLSVRSCGGLGAEECREVRNVGLNDEIARQLAAEDAHHAWDSYRVLIVSYAEHVKQLDVTPFQREIEEVKALLDEKCTLRRQHSNHEIPTDSMEKLVSKYKELYQEQAGHEFPQDPKEQLLATLAASARRGEEALSALVQASVPSGRVGMSGAGRLQLSTAGLCGQWLPGAGIEELNSGCQTEVDDSMVLSQLESEMPSAYASLLQCQDILKHHFEDLHSVDFVVRRGQTVLLRARQEKDVDQASDAETEDELTGCAMSEEPADDNLSEWTSASELTPGARADEEAPVSVMLWYYGGVLVPRQALGGDEPASWARTAKLVPLVWAQSWRSPEPGRAAAADAASAEDEVPAAEGAPSPRRGRPASLPFWQTAVAGAAAGIATNGIAAIAESFKPVARSCQQPQELARAMMAACPRGKEDAARVLRGNAQMLGRSFFTGAFCCTAYFRFLCNASADGSPDTVSPLRRLGCAAAAVATATTLAHPLDAWQQTARTSLQRQELRSLIASGDVASVCRGFLGRGPCSLPVKLRASVPIMALEMCGIDMVKNAGVSAGCEVSPGLLLCAGGVAGAVSTTVMNPVTVARCLNASTAMADLGRGRDERKHGSLQDLAHQSTARLREVGVGYAGRMTAVGANSLLRVGMVTYFLASGGGH